MKKSNNIRFFDCCSGMGGATLGFKLADMECVGRCETDTQADAVYENIFGCLTRNYGDVTRVNPAELPDFEVLVAGMAGEPFSKMGNHLGGADKRSFSIFAILNILAVKDTPCCMFEFVDGILSDEHSAYRDMLIGNLSALGYQVQMVTANTKNFGLPISKNRVYYIGCKYGFSFSSIETVSLGKSLEDCLCDTDNAVLDTTSTKWKEYLYKSNKHGYDIDSLLREDYVIVDRRQSDLRVYRDIAPTLRSGNHGLFYTKNGQLRKVTAYEAMMMLGVPQNVAEHIKAHSPVSEAKLLSMVGCLMPIPVAYCIGKYIFDNLNYAPTSKVVA